MDNRMSELGKRRVKRYTISSSAGLENIMQGGCDLDDSLPPEELPIDGNAVEAGQQRSRGRIVSL